MPVYELEILEPEGGVSRGEHVSPYHVRYHVGDLFEHQGRTLRVKLLERVEQADSDERLVCIPDSASIVVASTQPEGYRPARP